MILDRLVLLKDQYEAVGMVMSKNAKDVWHDHATQTVFAVNTATPMIPWAFKPYYWHWLQAAWVKP
jgi:hypothetical protein